MPTKKIVQFVRMETVYTQVFEVEYTNEEDLEEKILDHEEGVRRLDEINTFEYVPQKVKAKLGFEMSEVYQIDNPYDEDDLTPALYDFVGLYDDQGKKYGPLDWEVIKQFMIKEFGFVFEESGGKVRRKDNKGRRTAWFDDYNKAIVHINNFYALI